MTGSEWRSFGHSGWERNKKKKYCSCVDFIINQKKRVFKVAKMCASNLRFQEEKDKEK